MFETTMIHGRFQPFHNGHLEYLLEAFRLTRGQLIVGITNPSPDLIIEEVASNHRHTAVANPFTFYERQEMIRKSLAGIDETRQSLDRIAIVPFPIHHPELWKYYTPISAVQIMCLLEEWSHVKKNRFLEYGYKIHILNNCRITSGTDVRAIIREGGELHKYVPIGTLEVVRNLGSDIMPASGLFNDRL